MKLLVDFLPIIIFFASYKYGGIYFATGCTIIFAALQTFWYRYQHKRYETIHLVSLGILVVLGGATLFFRDPLFIKWKPTGIYWVTAICFVFSAYFTKKPLLQRLMETHLQLPQKIWRRLNYAWAFFFICLGALNLYVAYNYSTSTWVNFKLFGCFGMTVAFIALNALYLPKYLISDSITNQGSERSPPRNP